MKLIITRHGETEENRLGIMQGHLPGTLSKKGLLQAKELALKLKDEKIDVIYSSDLARALDTATEIKKFHSLVPFKTVRELRERDIGEFQGKKESDFGWYYVSPKPSYVESKEGESLEQLYTRAQSFLLKLLEQHANQTVLLVGHNGFNKALLCAALKKDPKEILTMKNTENASMYALAIKK